jgi:hypothetical protein
LGLVEAQPGVSDKAAAINKEVKRVFKAKPQKNWEQFTAIGLRVKEYLENIPLRRNRGKI